MIEAIVAASIGGFLSGMFGTYVAVKIIEVKIEAHDKRIARLEDKVFN